jgi:cyclopropane-fatty-acyl-phospholipid synthase
MADSTGTAILPARRRKRLIESGLGLTLRAPDGRVESYGEADGLVVTAHNERGMRALRSFDELTVVDAYLAGDIDIDGDLIAGMDLRAVMSDMRVFTRAWTFLQPLLLGRRRLNPGWVGKHYDSANMQLYGIDEEYQVYTPGLYLTDEDTMEEGAGRKLEYAFRALNLKSGDSLLDVGCGWGGFSRFCARRGVEVTGISLSNHQLEFARRHLAEEGLAADLRYQDFFDFEPGRQFDAICLMGSIEELSDYDKVMAKLRAWLRPGGLVYLDFAAVDRRFGVASFVTRYIWPGAFRMVYLPHFTRALARSHFDVVELRNDRRNYHLWAKFGYDKWIRRRDEVLQAFDERTWRMMHILQAGTAHIMSSRSIWATAYRVVLERRATPALHGTAARVYDEALMA